MSNIVDKIRALRAKAEDKASTEAEAALFAEKVQELMEKHHVEERDLLVEKLDHEKMRWIMRYACTWRRELADNVGRFTGCAFSWVTGTDRATYVGRPHLTQAALLMYEHLERQCVLIPREVYSDKRQQRRAEKGVALGLCNRLIEIRTNLPESRLPVVQEHSDAHEAQSKLMPNLKTKDTVIEIDSGEAYAGYKASDRVQIQPQTK